MNHLEGLIINSNFKLNTIHMKIKNLVAGITALMMFAQVTPSLAQEAQATLVSNKTLESNWLWLGASDVDFTLDRDSVSVEDSTQGFTSLKFIVKNGSINMYKCTVYFANGDTEDIEILNTDSTNEQSNNAHQQNYPNERIDSNDQNISNEQNNKNDGQVLKLMNNTSSIEKVIFWYNSKDKNQNRSDSDSVLVKNTNKSDSLTVKNNNSSDSVAIVELWGKK